MAPSTRIAAPATSTRRADISTISIGWTTKPQQLATSTTGCSPSIPTGSTRDRCGAAPWPRKAQIERSLTDQGHPISRLRRFRRLLAHRMVDVRPNSNRSRRRAEKSPTMKMNKSGHHALRVRSLKMPCAKKNEESCNETLRPKDRHQYETCAHLLGRKGSEATDRRGGHAEGREQGSGISIQKSNGNDASPRTG